MHSSIVIIDHAIYDTVHGKDFYMVKIISDVYKEFLIDTMNNIQSIKVQRATTEFMLVIQQWMDILV